MVVLDVEGFRQRKEKLIVKEFGICTEDYIDRVLGIILSTICANMCLSFPLAIQSGRLSFSDWSVEFKLYYRLAHV